MPHLYIRDLRLGFPAESCRAERAEAIARLTLELVRRAVRGRRWREFGTGALDLPPVETSFALSSDEEIARAGAAAIAQVLLRAGGHR